MNDRIKKLENPPLMANHIGFDCKSYALSAVLDWLYKSKLITIQPPPPRKRENKQYNKPSIRWFFKHQFNSKVGEVHNVEDLAAVAMQHEEVIAYHGECNSIDEYTHVLKKAIDQGRAPIVFFDVGQEELPTNDGGKSEHNAVVVGYSYSNNKLTFQISQYGEYFDFDSNAIFESTSQLPKNRTSQEKYYKVIRKKSNEGGWVNETFVTEYPTYSERAIKTTFETSPTSNNGLCKKILILDSKLYPKPELSTIFAKPSEPEVLQSQPKPAPKTPQDDPEVQALCCSCMIL